MNFSVCVKGARKISWNIRGPRSRPAPAGSRGPGRASGLLREEEVQARQVGKAALQALQGPAGPPSPRLASTEYGVAAIEVGAEGGGALRVPRAAYSISLGSPVADTTGGVFRMTCAAAEAPCTIAVKAAALSDTEIGGTVRFIPRVLVMRGGTPSTSVEPTETCEYADGAGGPAGARQSDQAGPWQQYPGLTTTS